jgi:MFS family permease
VLWIRKAVPEPEEWHQAKALAGENSYRFTDLFRGEVRRTTWLTLSVCALGLSGHWAFMFWCVQHLRNLPDLQILTEGDRSEIVAQATSVILGASIAGNFLAAFIAKTIGYRRAISFLCFGYFAAMVVTYWQPLTYEEMRPRLALIGVCQGMFCLFTMYLPALFPTLLRTTGAGFCYNIGRIAAAGGTVFFGLFTKVGDYRLAIFSAAFLFLPASIIGYMLPEPQDDSALGNHPEQEPPETAVEGELPL